MSDAVDPADLARLKARTTWAEDADGGRAECATGRHARPELAAGELPRCAHCGATLSPDALRRAGVRAQKT